MAARTYPEQGLEKQSQKTPANIWHYTRKITIIKPEHQLTQKNHQS
jgi:hypothetical protein